VARSRSSLEPSAEIAARVPLEAGLREPVARAAAARVELAFGDERSRAVAELVLFATAVVDPGRRRGLLAAELLELAASARKP